LTEGWREGRRDGGTEGRRDGGTEGRRDGGTEVNSMVYGICLHASRGMDAKLRFTYPRAGRCLYTHLHSASAKVRFT